MAGAAMTVEDLQARLLTVATSRLIMAIGDPEMVKALGDKLGAGNLEFCDVLKAMRRELDARIPAVHAQLQPKVVERFSAALAVLEDRVRDLEDQLAHERIKRMGLEAG